MRGDWGLVFWNNLDQMKKQIVAFSLTALLCAQNCLAAENGWKAYLDAGIKFHNAFKYADAADAFLRALNNAESNMAAESDIALCCSWLGGVRLKQGQYRDAEALYMRCLDIDLKLHGKSSLEVAEDLDNLGSVYEPTGRLFEAERLYVTSIKMKAEALGGKHPDVAESVNNLAELVKIQGKYSEAEPLYRVSIESLSSHYGKEHPKVASVINNLAGMYRIQARYAEAEQLFKVALQIRSASLGNNHPDVANSLNSLAVLYDSLGRYSEAEPLYKRSLGIVEGALGKTHPLVATMLANLAASYESQSRYSEAEPLYKRSIEIISDGECPDNQALAISLSNLAGLYESMGLYAEAEPIFTRSLSILETRFGTDHPYVATLLNNLGGLFRLQGRYPEAEASFRRSLALSIKCQGNTHPSVAVSLNNIAGLYESRGWYEQAETFYKHAIEILEKSYKDKHPELATIRHNLAGLLAAQGKLDEANKLYESNLSLAHHEDDQNVPFIATTLSSLAQISQYAGDFDRAESLFRQTLMMREKKLGGQHPHVATSLNYLASLLQIMGRYTEAEILYRRSTDIAGKSKRRSTFDSLAESQRFLRLQHSFERASAQFTSKVDLARQADVLEISVLNDLNCHKDRNMMEDFEKVLSLRRDAFGSQSPLVAEALMQIGIAFGTLGGSTREEAEKAMLPLAQFATYLLGTDVDKNKIAQNDQLQETMKRTEDYLGGKVRSLQFASDSLLCLSNVLASVSDDARAKEALELSEKCWFAKPCVLEESVASPAMFEPATNSTVDRLLALSTSWRLLSQFGKATQLIEHAADIANSANNDRARFKCELALARLNIEQGDYHPAETFAASALGLGEKAFGAERTELIACCQALAECATELGRPDDAIKYSKKVLSFPTIGKNERASGLVLLGNALLNANNPVEAKAKLNEALAISHQSDEDIDPNVFTTASALLGYALLEQGDVSEARRCFGAALSRNVLDPTADGALASARDLSGLAQVEKDAGDDGLSLRYSLEAAAKIAKYVADVFPQLSFGEQCAFLAIAKQQRDMLLSVCQNGDSLSSAYGYSMKWKGLLLESLRRKGAINSVANNNPELKPLVEELFSIRRQLSGLTNKAQSVREKDPEAFQRSNSLTARKEHLEVELATKSGVSLKDPIQGGADWLREQLQEDEAFIDILPYKPFKANNERYAAVAMKKGKGGEPRFFDLGDTPEMDKPAIEKLVSEWRFAVTGDKFEKARDSESDEDDAEKEAARVSSKQREVLTNRVAALLVNNPKILDFLNGSVAPIRKVWLCPEAAFARVPWNALATISSAAPLSICEVDSPREFVALRSEKAKVASGKRSIMLAGLKDFKKANLKDLGGALAEINALNDAAKGRGIDRKYLPEERATKDAVKENLELVTLAHIATHGFAAGGAAGSDSDRGSRSATRGLRAGGIRVVEGASLLSTARSPLVECGLYFAFPEVATSGKDELPNVMTAEEMIGLDLKNCDLVTLSACQTGLGRRMNGQGIIGLRSAIMGAGAKTILMSLWSVDDDATRELMKRFYGYIWDEEKPLSKVQALKKAQDEIREVPKWKDPKFWAGWVLSGDGWR